MYQNRGPSISRIGSCRLIWKLNKDDLFMLSSLAMREILIETIDIIHLVSGERHHSKRKSSSFSIDFFVFIRLILF